MSFRRNLLILAIITVPTVADATEDDWRPKILCTNAPGYLEAKRLKAEGDTLVEKGDYLGGNRKYASAVKAFEEIKAQIARPMMMDGYKYEGLTSWAEGQGDLVSAARYRKRGLEEDFSDCEYVAQHYPVAK